MYRPYTPIRQFIRCYHKQEPILTEHVYGRKRIYTCLPTIAKTKPGTVSKPCITPLSWQWSGHEEDVNKKKNWYEMKSQKSSVLASMKQNWREMFLPVGYPESVHSCYKRFHYWLFLETYVGSAIGVLCSQAMLASLGLGTMEATGGAVAIQWVLKDGFGEVGKLFFIKRYASSFDSHPKTWKLVCELLSSVGSLLQLCTSVVSPKLFLPLAATGNMFELIHESIWVASHMTFTKHFAPNGNIGDIVAKDDAQMSTAHLLGMLSGVGLISVSHTPLFLFGVFAVLSPINIWSTVKLLNAADFEILNQAKLTLLSREFINQGSVIGYDQLKNKEIGFGEWVKPSAHIVKINLGASAEQAYENTDEIRDVLEIMKHENYLLNYHDHTMWVSLHEDATSNDVIRAILHSMKLHDALKDGSKGFLSCLQDTLEWSKEKYPKFVVELDQKNWQSDIVYWNDSGVRLDWKNHIKENDDPVIIN